MSGVLRSGAAWRGAAEALGGPKGENDWGELVHTCTINTHIYIYILLAIYIYNHVDNHVHIHIYIYIICL